MTSINVQTREAEAVALRAAGRIPAVVYGGDRTEATHVSLGATEFQKLYEAAGESTLIDFTVDGGDMVKVVIQDVQYDPVKGNVIHVDFKQIKMGEEMQATVELTFVGEAPAVKELGATLVKQNETVTIKCLPKDLLSTIEVDLSVLKTLDDSIKVSDLPVPENVTILEDATASIVGLSAALTEEQITKMEEEADSASVDNVEVEEKGKKEEGEGEAGEAAPEQKAE